MHRTERQRALGLDPSVWPRKKKKQRVCGRFETAEAEGGQGTEFRVSASYLEIYNEVLKDLLNPSPRLHLLEMTHRYSYTC